MALVLALDIRAHGTANLSGDGPVGGPGELGQPGSVIDPHLGTDDLQRLFSHKEIVYKA